MVAPKNNRARTKRDCERSVYKKFAELFKATVSLLFALVTSLLFVKLNKSILHIAGLIGADGEGAVANYAQREAERESTQGEG